MYICYVLYLFAFGHLVTSVVDKLNGRCIARRRASSGTSSTPPDIIHILVREFFSLFLCCWLRIFFSICSLEFSLSCVDLGSTFLHAFGSPNLVPQLQQHLVQQHIIGNIVDDEPHLSDLSIEVFSSCFLVTRPFVSRSRPCMVLLSVQPYIYCNRILKNGWSYRICKFTIDFIND